jgi:hypothetical protein
MQVQRTQPSRSQADAERSKERSGSPGAASQSNSKKAHRLRAGSGCDSDQKPFVRFRWSPAADRGQAQRVDYTEFFDGLSSGNFDKSPKLPGDKGRWRTAKVESGVHYEWRVTTLRAGRLVRSAIASFDGAVCLKEGK